MGGVSEPGFFHFFPDFRYFLLKAYEVAVSKSGTMMAVLCKSHLNHPNSMEVKLFVTDNDGSFRLKRTLVKADSIQSIYFTPDEKHVVCDCGRGSAFLYWKLNEENGRMLKSRFDGVGDLLMLSGYRRYSSKSQRMLACWPDGTDDGRIHLTTVNP